MKTVNEVVRRQDGCEHEAEGSTGQGGRVGLLKTDGRRALGLMGVLAALVAAGCGAALGPAGASPASAEPAAAAEASPSAEAPPAAGDAATPAGGAAASTASAPSGSSDTASGKAQPIAVDLSALRLSDDTQEVHVQAGGADRQIVVVGPDSDAKGPRPLVVFLHGQKSNGLKEAMRCLVKPGFESVAPIVVAPKSDKAQWWVDSETSFILGLVDAAKKSWPVQANQVVITGYSNGGIGSWALARLYPDWFSAAIPIAGNDTIVGEAKIPVFDIHGSKDDTFPLGPIEAAVNQLKQKGQNVTLLVKNRGTHDKPCTYREELEQAADWLKTSVWKAN